MNNFELEEQLLKEEQPEGFVKEGWCPADYDEMDWFLEKIKLEEEKDLFYLNILEKKIENYNAKLKKQKEIMQDKKERAESVCFKFLETVPEDQLKETKTQIKLQLATADIVKKKGTMKVVRDDDMLLKWLKKQEIANKYIENTEKVKWKELKKITDTFDDIVIIKETGEIVEGVTLEKQADTINIKF